MATVLVVALAALVMWLIELCRPGVRLPRTPFWWGRVALLNAVQVGAVFLGAQTWDRWLPEYRVWDSAPTGVGGVALGYGAITFVFYWWHRARHEIPLLWRLHQVHHSPVRIEVAMSFYKHPLEIVLNSFICSILLHTLLGLTPQVAASVMAIAGLGELVYHWNVRTPYWLGFFFQRPESHRRHHERHVHRGNYSDLPIWDMLFGTFDNPRQTPLECGFSRHRETQLLRMLMGRTPR